MFQEDSPFLIYSCPITLRKEEKKEKTLNIVPLLGLSLQ